jgi:hypothetical protein
MAPAARVGVPRRDGIEDRPVLRLRPPHLVGAEMEQRERAPGVAHPVPEVLDRGHDETARRRLERPVEVVVGAAERVRVGPLARALDALERPARGAQRDVAVARRRLAHGEHLEPHAHRDALQHLHAGDRHDGRAAMALERDQPVALEHPKRLAHGHLRQPEIVRETAQHEPRAGRELASAIISRSSRYAHALFVSKADRRPARPSLIGRSHPDPPPRSPSVAVHRMIFDTTAGGPASAPIAARRPPHRRGPGAGRAADGAVFSLLDT